MKSIFITGTDTDAGKTFVTAGIVSALRNSGVDAMPAKPVQTGCVNDTAPDLEYILNHCGLDLSRAERNRLCPVRYEPACSPHFAAELAGEEISIRDLTMRMQNLEKEFKCIVAEGAGGVLVPICPGITMLDLMEALGWQVVLVSCDRLGTINHTLLSIQAIRQRGLSLAGVVINHCQPPDPLISRSNTRAIREYGAVDILGEIPHSPTGFPHKAFSRLCHELTRKIEDGL